MNLTLKVWRQKNTNSSGKMVTYPVKDVSPDMSFLEMLDVLNEELLEEETFFSLSMFPEKIFG